MGRLLRCVATLLAALPHNTPAQPTPVTRADLDAIAAALGVELRNVHGLVTIQMFDGGGGGLLQLPPAAASDALCRFERRWFEGSSTTGYRALGEPSSHYWLSGAVSCVARTAADLPAQVTYLSASIPPADVRAILEHTEELIGLARDGERCQPQANFWRQFVPRYLGGVSSRNGGYEATLADPADAGTGVTFKFSLADGEPQIAGMVCWEDSVPFGFEDRIWEFVLP